MAHAKGESIEQDFKEAVKWYRKAAEQRHVLAQESLGVMYYEGRGVAQDNQTAYAWLNIAATNGNQKVNKKGLSQLGKAMTPVQIVEAWELVKEMVEMNPKLLK
ncbi:sel1 repeat family protein [Verrucomicrobia bacterium]|nr:sel1 repeat family protein [Verrucomicrobiota bacterium]